MYAETIKEKWINVDEKWRTKYNKYTIMYML